MKKEKILIITIVALCIITLIGTTLAVFSTTIHGTKKVSIQAGTLKVDYTDGNIINLQNAAPMSNNQGLKTTPYTFTLTNTGNIKAYYTISIEEDANNTLDNNLVKFRLTSDAGYDSGIETVGVYGSGTFLIASEAELAVNETVTYTLYLWLSDQADNSVQGQIYQSKIVVNSTSNPIIKGELASSVLLANNPVKEEKTNMFNYASNGKYWDTTTNAESTEANSEYITNGLYSKEDEDGLSYYFRGEVNNIVQFGTYQNDYYVYRINSQDFASLETCQYHDSTCNETNKVLKYTKGTPMYWKIVRINGDGSLRLLYNGTSADATGYEVTIGQSSYNINYNDPKYTGYTYDNGTDSTIKKAIDSWYQTSLSGSSYDSKVVNGRFCSDSSNFHNDSNFGFIFASYDRLEAPIRLGTGNVAPTLRCSVTSESYGGSYRLKAGLLTADEMVLGGESHRVINENTYLYDGAGEIEYWSMTPAVLSLMHAFVWSVNDFFSNGSVDRGNLSARPVINLNTGIRITAGSGTASDPYIIE